MKIQSRLLLAVIPVLVLVFISTSILNGFVSSRALEKEAKEKAELLSASFGDQLENRINHYSSIALDLGNSAITSMRVDATLELFRRRYPQLRLLFYSHSDGQTLFVHPYSREMQDWDFSGDPLWQKCRETRELQISPPGNHFGVESILFYGPALIPYLTNQDPQFHGVVVMVLPLDELFQGITNQTIGESGEVLISQQEGHIFAGGHNDGISISELSDDPILTEVEESMRRGRRGFARYDRQGVLHYLAFVPLTSLNWTLSIHGNYSSITTEVRRLTLINLTALSIGLLLGAAIIYLSIHRMVRPIEELTQMALIIAKGDRNITSHIQDNSEIGLLSQAINSMVKELRDSQEELEKTVDKRTMQLQRSNEDLEDTVEELNSTNEALQFIRKNLEQTVEERTQQVKEMSFLVESAGTPIAMTRLNGFISYVNPSFVSTWDYRRKDQLLDRPIADFWKLPLEQDQFINHLLEVEQYSVEIQALNSSKALFDVHLSAALVRNDEEKPIAIMFSSPDITARKKAEAELRNTRNYINAMINSMASQIIGLDAQGLITHWNRRAREFWGMNEEAVLGKDILSIAPDLANILQSLPTAIETREEQRENSHQIKLEDKVYYQDIVISPLITSQSKGVVLRIDDITERKEMEEILRQSQKMDALGKLAGGIAHDFNNMLGGILGGAELLEDYLKDDESQDFLELIQGSATQAADLTGKLLTFARKGVREVNPIDLHQAIGGAVDLLEHSLDKRIGIETRLLATQSTVMGDLSLLQNVFLNLGINAGHAMPEGGLLSYSTGVIEIDEESCRKSSFEIFPGSFIEAVVEDQGTGIPKEIQDKIFDPFFTTKEKGKGTGLGLASVLGTVIEHHGSLEVSSQENQGTTFRICLPLSSQEARNIDPHSAPLKGSGTILVMDDEAVIRRVAKAMLERLGYKVIMAENGRQGLEYLEKNPGEVDLILSDMIMPEMTGRQLFAALEEKSIDLPFVIASGYSQETDLEDLLNKGIEGFIRKPYHIKELSHVIYRALKK